MTRLVSRLAAGIVGLLLLAVVVTGLLLRGSLPSLDGDLHVMGLHENVMIERDDAGVPTITASNRQDLAFATGFAHGQDRFFQMDLIRRQAAGELSALVGSAAINVDKRFRLHRFRARSRAVLELATDEQVELLRRYADGVNAGRNSLDVRPFEYLVLNAKPTDWRPEDSILVVFAMFVDLNDSRASGEIRRGFARSALPAAVYDWMYPQGTPWDAPLMGVPRAPAAIPSEELVTLRSYADSAEPANEQGKPLLKGSNNWAVSGDLTKSGRALVSNDMHLGLSVPNIYYRARLVVAGDEYRDLSGVTLPGTPFIVAGSNTRIAWGYTNSYGDYTDAVLLRPGAKDGTYRTPEGDRAFSVFEEQIEVKGADPVSFTVRETEFGPVLDDVSYPYGEVAVSWTAHKPGSVNLNIFRLETATSVFEALDIANTIGIPPQNFVTGDADGNIGWTIAGKIPLKADFDAMLPADWSEQRGWLGWVAASDYPRVVNPESGRIWTANARVSDGEALKVIGDGGYALGARAKQIRDALYARETFTPEDMLALQVDDRALFLAPWRDVILQVLDDDAVADDAQLMQYRQLVRDWIPRAVPESVGYRFVRGFRLEVQRRLFHALTVPVREMHGDDVPLRISNQFEAPVWSMVNARPDHLLPAGYEDWDEFLLAVIIANIRYYSDNYEGTLADRTWGEINTAAIRHPLSGSIPILGDYLNMPAEALSGDSNLPKAQSPSSGASERFSVSPGDEANSLFQMPTGQSGHPLSAYYRRGHSDWVNATPRPYLPGKPAHALTLSPDRR